MVLGPLCLYEAGFNKPPPYLLLLQLSLNSLTYLNLAGNVIKDEVSDEKIFGELQKIFTTLCR